MEKIKRIVAIGGGKGLLELVPELLRLPHVKLTVVVSMMDDGGSSGQLRRAYGILPPGDFRRALLAASPLASDIQTAWEHRFARGLLRGHVAGNLLLASFLQTQSVAQATVSANRLLQTRASVLPVTDQLATVVAELKNGRRLVGESKIDVPHGKRAAIARVHLQPVPRLLPDVRQAIARADAVIIGPGDLYTSVLPPLLTRGMSQALRQSRAKKIYLCNVCTKFGETDGYSAADFFAALQKHLGRGIISHMLVNTAQPSASQRRVQQRLRREFINYQPGSLPASVRVSAGNFLGQPDVYRNGRRHALAIARLL